MPDETFAEFLRRVLAQSGLSLSQTAKSFKHKGYKIDKSTLARWANGDTRPRRDKLPLLHTLPDIIGMTPAELSDYNCFLRQFTGGRLIQSAHAFTPEHRSRFLGGRVAYFTGRKNELRRLQTAVSHRQSILITGLGGIGKTTLAKRLLEIGVHHFDYGCDALQLSPFQQIMDVVIQIGQRLGISMTVEEAGQDADLALAQLRQRGGNVDMLFLLDNVDRAEQIRPLLTGLPTITWIITSRRKLFLPVPGLIQLPLPLPAAPEAAQILLHYAGIAPTKDNHILAQQITAHLGYLPIALRVAAGLIATEQLTDLRQLQRWLEERCISAIQIESWDIADFFSELLQMATPSARQLFELCGLFADPTIPLSSLTAVAHKLNLSMTPLDQLESLSLIQKNSDHTLSLHPLIHEYAAKRTRESVNYTEMCRYFTIYYAHHAAERRGEPDQLQPEFNNIQLASEYGYQINDWGSLRLLWGPITGYLWVQSQWQAYRAYNERFLEMVRKQDDPHLEARIISEIGWIYFEEGNYAAATPLFHQAKMLFDALNAKEERIRIYRHLGILYTGQKRLDLAAQFLSDAEILTQQIGNTIDSKNDSKHFHLAMIYHAQADVARKRFDYPRAQMLSRRALASVQKTKIQNVIPMLRLLLGDILYKQGQYVEAEQIWRDIALHGHKVHPERRVIITAMCRVSQIDARNGRLERALEWVYEARKICVQIGITSILKKTDAQIEWIKSTDKQAIHKNEMAVFELWD